MNINEYIAIIPARYGSSRFPGKPLALLNNKPIIQHVYESVSKVIPSVYVATDDERIFDAVTLFGGKAVMTSSLCKNGTERIAEAITKLGNNWKYIINVQGDEPFIHDEQILDLCESFDDKDAQIATLGIPFKTLDQLENVNSPKIVLDKRSYAMYFSRSVIPFVRGKERIEWLKNFQFLKHIGIYGYKTDVLKEIAKLPSSPLELAESLEQLRWLENGYKIKVVLTTFETIGIDTPADLKRAQLYINQRDGLD